MSFSCQKGEFDRFFNRLDQPVEESRPDRQPDRPVDPPVSISGALTDCTSLDHFFEHELPYFGFVEESYENLLRTLDSLNDVEFKKKMSEGIVDSFELQSCAN